MTDQIWKEFKAPLLSFILSRVEDKEVAKDLLQDVFVRIHQKADQLNDQDRLHSWIYQITRNRIIDHYRSRKSGEQLKEAMLPEVDDDDKIPADFTRCLIPHIKRLPEKDQELLLAVGFGDTSQIEYARKHQLSPTTVRSRVQRARKKLKASFVACCKIETDTYGNVIDATDNDCSC